MSSSARPALTGSVPRVLVKEPIADAGVDLLRDQFDVELGFEMSEQGSTDRSASMTRS